MSTVLKTRLIKIGNSQGIRIPKVLLEQLGLTHDIELEIQGEQLVLRAARRPRQDWEAQFQRMAEHGDDHLLDPDTRSSASWDDEEWTWE